MTKQVKIVLIGLLVILEVLLHDKDNGSPAPSLFPFSFLCLLDPVSQELCLCPDFPAGISARPWVIPCSLSQLFLFLHLQVQTVLSTSLVYSPHTLPKYTLQFLLHSPPSTPHLHWCLKPSESSPCSEDKTPKFLTCLQKYA